jgi:hypothetical protein
MTYHGPLFGKHHRTYIPLIMTSEDVDKAIDERNQLREALQAAEPFMQHAMNCPMRAGYGPCACGMEAAQRLAQKTLRDAEP